MAKIPKILICGDSDSGKTSLYERILNDKFEKTTPTIGMGMKVK